MSSAKVALLSGLSALALSACGAINVKPSGTTSSGVAASRGRVDDPRINQSNHIKCLRADGLSVQEIGSTDLEIAGTIRVQFTSTPGVAQGDQIQNREQAAEVIGSALLYPGQAPDSELTLIEHCLAQGVAG